MVKIPFFFFLLVALESFFVQSFLIPHHANPEKQSRLPLFAEGKLNNKIDLESEKVVNIVDMKDGEKKVYCRCWKSDTFPLCNGAHVAHNKETGDNVGPLIINTKNKKEEESD